MLLYKALKYKERKYLRKMLYRYDPSTRLVDWFQGKRMSRLANKTDMLHEPRTDTMEIELSIIVRRDSLKNC